MRSHSRAWVMGIVVLAAFAAPTGISYALWNAPATATVTVSTAAPSLAAPLLKCGAWKNNNAYTVSWTAVTGATAYSVSTATTNTDASYTEVTPSTTSTSADVSVTSDVTLYVRVKAKTSSTSSAFSNTLKLTRSGNGNANISCQAVTP